MHLIVGLGNPGGSYAGTRHNAGFMALDVLAGRHGLDVGRRRFSSLVGSGRIAEKKVILAKPQEYMNLSGEAVRLIVDYYNVSPVNLVVLHDDLDVAFGRIKVAARGGAGGHKGVASIIRHLGVKDFTRVKIGLGRPPEGWETENYVLGRFNETELGAIQDVLVCAAEAAEVTVAHGAAEAQALFNRRDLIIS